jgi:hypothetical protein
VREYNSITGILTDIDDFGRSLSGGSINSGEFVASTETGSEGPLIGGAEKLGPGEVGTVVEVYSCDIASGES